MSDQAKKDRGKGGRFAKGNRAAVGHGRKPASLRATFAEVAVEQWPALMRTLFGLAIAGDMAAMGLCLKYGLGNPKDTAADEDERGANRFVDLHVMFPGQAIQVAGPNDERNETEKIA